MEAEPTIDEFESAFMVHFYGASRLSRLLVDGGDV